MLLRTDLSLTRECPKAGPALTRDWPDADLASSPSFAIGPTCLSLLASSPASVAVLSGFCPAPVRPLSDLEAATVSHRPSHLSRDGWRRMSAHIPYLVPWLGVVDRQDPQAGQGGAPSNGKGLGLDQDGTPLRSLDKARTVPGLRPAVRALPAAPCCATSGSDEPPGPAACPGAGRPAAGRRRSGRHPLHRPALALGRKRGRARWHRQRLSAHFLRCAPETTPAALGQDEQTAAKAGVCWKVVNGTGSGVGASPDAKARRQ